jgi:hypothetical protein
MATFKGINELHATKQHQFNWDARIKRPNSTPPLLWRGTSAANLSVESIASPYLASGDTTVDTGGEFGGESGCGSEYGEA